MSATGRTQGDLDIRLICGRAVLALALLLPLVALVIGFTSLLGDKSREWVGVLVNGPSEILCLLAACILGNKYYGRAIPGMTRLTDPAVKVSRLRYYCGIAGCLFNFLPLYLYAYFPDMMPTGSTKYFTIVIADLVFVGSLFFAGGELWEKIRKVFVWEGIQPVPAAK